VSVLLVELCVCVCVLGFGDVNRKVVVWRERLLLWGERKFILR
jgi:hypothetical protein